MPTLLIENGFRFFFYSNENNEPCHIHVEKDNAYGKIWLEPDFEINYFHNFTIKEKKTIIVIVQKNIENFKKKWYEYFDK